MNVAESMRYRWHFSFLAATSSPSNLSNGCFWQDGTGKRWLRQLHTEAIAKENWTPIAVARYKIQIYLYVENSFYGTQFAQSDTHHIGFDQLHGVNALPLVHNEFAFLGAVGLVFVLCNAPLSFEQSHCKTISIMHSMGETL